MAGPLERQHPVHRLAAPVGLAERRGHRAHRLQMAGHLREGRAGLRHHCRLRHEESGRQRDGGKGERLETRHSVSP